MISCSSGSASSPYGPRPVRHDVPGVDELPRGRLGVLGEPLPHFEAARIVFGRKVNLHLTIETAQPGRDKSRLGMAERVGCTGGAGMTMVTLIRHAHPQAAITGVVAGPKGDTGLSDLGRQQAAALRDRLLALGFTTDVVLTSILPRAVETAQILAPALGEPEIEQDCDLCELHPGDADGIPWDRVPRSLQRGALRDTRRAVRAGRRIAPRARTTSDRAPWPT